MIALAGKAIALYALWRAWRSRRWTTIPFGPGVAIEVDEASPWMLGRELTNVRTGETVQVVWLRGNTLGVRRS